MNERIRREPPRFRTVVVRAVEDVTPRLKRVTLAGEELAGMDPPQLASSVRLLLSDETPTWNGNEFLLADGSRPVIRTFTPLRFSASAGTLDIEIVRHGGGAASEWVASAAVGDEVALSGPGRGYEIDAAATAFVIAGDETALPAIGQLLEAVPESLPASAHVEIADSSARIDGGAYGAVEWHELPSDDRPGDALVGVMAALDIPDAASVWVAGEAAAVQRIRKHLFDERGLTRSQATVRGYWKHGRTGGADD